MYVCICNALTEDDVHGCLAEGGCRTTKQLKAACGFKPGCGSCTKRLHSMVSEYRTASELADALTGGPLPLTAVPDAPAEQPAAPAGRPGTPPELPEALPAAQPPGAPAVPEPATAADRTVPQLRERGTAPPTAA